MEYSWVKNYLGRSYSSAYGCLDFVVEVLEKEFKYKNLPKYAVDDGISQRKRSALLAQALADNCAQVLETGRRSGDIVVINVYGRPTHVGLFLEPNYILHTISGDCVCLENVDSIMLKNRIQGYFRPAFQMELPFDGN